VDTIIGGNRERDLRTGFTLPPKLTLSSLMSFATHPGWALNFLFREAFELSQLKDYVEEGSNITISIGDYITKMLDQSLNWDDAEKICQDWGGQFCLKGIMSVADAKRAVEIGATSIMISNHGGRQLDGSRTPFDQIAEIADAVGGDIDIVLDGGIKRGTHVLKAMAAGATACSGGRFYLYALAAAGQAGVEKTLGNLRAEIERDMKLMGITKLSDLNRDMLRYRDPT
ncbi:MAG TPA: alpha-hydroxy-acid oxidizing enzyme, partial [Rhodospirillaceae bacterium]|nr:alpha-hydroxy-acid oxidizing enzyme [Rhodospirillaceae bacterium]